MHLLLPFLSAIVLFLCQGGTARPQYPRPIRKGSLSTPCPSSPAIAFTVETNRGSIDNPDSLCKNPRLIHAGSRAHFGSSRSSQLFTRSGPSRSISVSLLSATEDADFVTTLASASATCTSDQASTAAHLQVDTVATFPFSSQQTGAIPSQTGFYSHTRVHHHANFAATSATPATTTTKDDPALHHVWPVVIENITDLLESLASTAGDKDSGHRQQPGTSTMTSAKQTNVFDILLEALPTNVASSLEAQYSITRQQSPSASATDSQTRVIPATISSGSGAFSTTMQSSTITTIPTSSTPLSQSSIQSTTTTTQSSSLSSTVNPASSPSASPPAPSAESQNSPSTGTIAGAATGGAAGVVLVLAALLYFLRFRRRRGAILPKSLSPTSRRKSAVFPEVAWLYDPITPSSRSGGAAGSPPSASQSSRAHHPYSPVGSPFVGPDRLSTPAVLSPSHIPGMVELPLRAHSPPEEVWEFPAPPSFVSPVRNGSPRSAATQHSHPTPTLSVREETPDDAEMSAVSPLLPPPPRSFVRFASPVRDTSSWSRYGNRPSPSDTIGPRSAREERAHNPMGQAF